MAPPVTTDSAIATTNAPSWVCPVSSISLAFDRTWDCQPPSFCIVTYGIDAGVDKLGGDFSQTYTGSYSQKIINTTANTAVRSLADGKTLREFGYSLEDAYKTLAIDTAAEKGANWIGENLAEGSLKEGVGSTAYWQHKGAHALLGCAVGAAKAGECGSGAVGAVIGEVIGEAVAKPLIQDGEFSDTDKWLTRTAGTTAAIFGTSAIGGDFNVASDTAQNAIDNNLDLISQIIAAKIGNDTRNESKKIGKTIDNINELEEKAVKADKDAKNAKTAKEKEHHKNLASSLRLQANEALEKVKLQINKGIININNISDKVIKEGFKTKGSLLDTWRHGTWIRDAANTFLVGQVEARDSGFLNEIQGQLRNPSSDYSAQETRKDFWNNEVASKIGRKQQLEIAPDGKLINNQLINNANSIPDFNKPLTAKDWWKAFTGTYTNGTNNK